MKLTASAVAILLIALATLAGCKKPAGSPAQANAAAPKPPEVIVSTPTIAEVTDYEDFTGRTVAYKVADIRPHVTGYLDKVLFTEGADVQKDAVLYEIDPRIYEAEVERAKSNVQQAEAHLKRLNSDLQRANIMLPNKSISRQDYDQIVGDQAEAEAAVGVAKATLHAAEVNLGYTKIDAPFGGRLSRTMMDPGNLVKVDDTVLTTIVQIDPMYVMFGVDERLLKKIHDFVQSGLVKTNNEGKIPILMGLANEEGFPHSGYVDFIDNRLDMNTGSLLVRGLFTNPKKSVLPGLFCRVRLPLGDAYRAITIPEQALGTDQGQKFVYVVDPQNKVQYRSVQIGKQQGSQRVILKGVEEGDRVVISGLQRVRPGVVVDPKPGNATAQDTSRESPEVKKN